MRTIILNFKSFFEEVSQAQDHLRILITYVAEKKIRTILAVPNSLIPYTHSLIKGNPIFSLAAQSVDQSGAYTGNDNIALLKSMGCNYAFVGHPETRISRGWLEEDIAEQYELCIQNDVVPIVFIGTSFEHPKSDLFSIVDYTISAIQSSMNEFAIFILEHGPDYNIIQSSKQIYTSLKKNKSIPFFSFGVGGNIVPELVSELAQMDECEYFVLGSTSMQIDQLKLFYDTLTKTT